MSEQTNHTGGEKRLSAFEVFSPKQVFLGGIAMGFLVLCTIGFFILLPGALGGASNGGGNKAEYYPASPDNAEVPKPTEVSVKAVDSKDHVRGNKNAKITLIEYSDFECPFCARFLPSVEQALKEYPNDVRLVYRHFPLGFHQQARPAANASECAAEQGKFWEYHDELFVQQSSLSSDNIYTSIAKSLGLNVNKFNECFKSNKYDKDVADDISSGTLAGVGGTPHTILVGPNGETIPLSGALPYEQIKAAIESVLK